MGNGRKVVSNTANGNLTPQQNTVKTNNSSSRSKKQREREEREKIVIWKQPLKTLEYFTKEVFVLLYTFGKKYGFFSFLLN